MRCPICLNELSVTHRDRYESLSEHVSDPNGTPSMKDGYQCTTRECIAHTWCVTWTDDGDFYMSSENVPPGMNSSYFEKASTTGMYYALDSWSHTYGAMEKDKKKRTHTLHIGKWMINVVPTYDENYKRRLFRWKWEYWKKRDNVGGYVLVIPMSRMVKFCIREFKRHYNKALYSHNKYSIEKCLKCIQKDAEKRYVRVANFILRTFYSQRVHIIEQLAKNEDVKA